jgi:lipopolysaccharide biosynthesis regulator YciM
MPEVAGEIQNCYNRLGQGKSWEDYLNGLVERHSSLEYLRKNQQQLHSSLLKRLRYRCDACGFTSRKLFWQCPGCQSWISVKPLSQECRTSDSSLQDAL